jgi:hypothetical protein
MSRDPEARHVDAATLEAYAAGLTDVVAETSVEAHLITCPACRALLADRAALGEITPVDPQRLEQVWHDVMDVVDTPKAGLVERALRRLGVAASPARLIAAAPSLRTSWVLGIVTTLVFAAVAAAAGRHGVGLFLALAPVLPVAGVAVAYGRRMDPVHEIAAAASYSAARLILLRSAAVLGLTLPLVLLAGLLLPSAPLWVAAAWLLPAVAFTAATLAAGTFIDPLWAGIAITTVWVSLVAAASIRRNNELALVGLRPQLAFFVLLLAAVAILVVRRDRLAPAGSLT